MIKFIPVIFSLLILGGCASSGTYGLWDTYLDKPHNKAYALGTNGKAGAAWEYDTPEQAAHVALNTCITDGGENCRITDVNGNKPPKSLQLADSANAASEQTPAKETKTSPVQPTVAQVEKAKKLKVIGSGTAFYINSNYLLTNQHVVNECKEITVVVRGREREAQLINADRINDLAVLETLVTSEETAVFRNPKSGIRKGEKSYVFGFPYSAILSSEPKITDGIVNSTSGLFNDSRYLQISAPIQPGNSGSPLIDSSGNVMGLVTKTITTPGAVEVLGNIPQNINFAIRESMLAAYLAASNIEFEYSNASSDKDAPQVAELAEAFTHKILCWN